MIANAAGGAIDNSSATALVRAIQYENASDNPTAGNRTIAISVTDDGGATSAAAVGTVSVGSFNDAPVAVDDAITTDENTAVTGAAPGVLGKDRDADGDSLAVSSVGGGTVGTTIAGSAGGQFVINADGSYRFDPGADFQLLKAGETRVTSVSYVVSDGHGGSAPATLSVSVTGVNDAPVGSDGSNRTNEDTSASGFLPAATDPDGDFLTFAVATPPANGVVTISANGSYTYTPPVDFNGNDCFTYTVSDGTATVTYTIAIEVVPVDDGPVGSPIAKQAYSDTQTVQLDVSGYFSDIDTAGLAFSATGLPKGLSISADGVITGTVSRDASQPNGGIYSVTVFARDGNSSVDQTFTVTVSNPPPVARDDAASTSENADTAGSVFADNGNGVDVDPDGDAIVVRAVNGTAANLGAPAMGTNGGQFVISSNGGYRSRW